MPLNDVSIYTSVRVKVCGIEAETQVDAIRQARDVLSKNPGVLNRSFRRDEDPLRSEISYVADAEDPQGYLVDVRGDHEYRMSTSYDADERVVTSINHKSGPMQFDVNLSNGAGLPGIAQKARFSIDVFAAANVVQSSSFLREEGRGGQITIAIPSTTVDWYREGKTVPRSGMTNVGIVVTRRFFKLSARLADHAIDVISDPIPVKALADHYGIEHQLQGPA